MHDLLVSVFRLVFVVFVGTDTRNGNPREDLCSEDLYSEDLTVRISTVRICTVRICTVMYSDAQ